MKSYDFSVAIPSWKNPAYLKNCIDSLINNSRCRLQIIVYLNEACSTSRDYLKELKSDNIFILENKKNVGICVALNACSRIAEAPYFIYLNDDMYALPFWDKKILDKIESRTDDMFMYSGTMIEPHDTQNSAVVNANFGSRLENFREQDLIEAQKSLEREDWSGSSWPPAVTSLRLWKAVDGYSEEFSPGFYSDPDFSMKLYQMGVRDFRGIGDSLVYHFSQISTTKISDTQLKGKQLFLCKWKIKSSIFYKYYLRMGQKYNGDLTSPQIPLRAKISNRWKLLWTKCPQ